VERTPTCWGETFPKTIKAVWEGNTERIEEIKIFLEKECQRKKGENNINLSSEKSTNRDD